jgi:hypothetical protein
MGVWISSFHTLDSEKQENAISRDTSHIPFQGESMSQKRRPQHSSLPGEGGWIMDEPLMRGWV